MTKVRADTDMISLDWQGSTLILRPSLRAALRLARHQGGFPALLRQIGEFHTGTICEIIRASSTDPIAAETFLRGAAKAPLASFAEATQGPALELMTALLTPADDASEEPSTGSNTMTFEEGFKQLFKIATGWLGWTPETAWQATPQEITLAMNGHIEKLAAMNGAKPSSGTKAKPKPVTQAELDHMVIHGDPSFDREAFQALKARHAKAKA